MSMYAPEQMGPPPMMGGGGPPPMGPPPGPPPDQGPPPEPQQSSDEDEIRNAISMFRGVAERDGLDESERLILEQITTLGQKLLAGREKQDQALLGGGPATQALSRAYGG